MSKRVLLTGGCGFIGHHTVEHFLKNTDWDIIVLDRLSYAGNLNFLTDIEIWEKEKHRVKVVGHDIRFTFEDTHIQSLLEHGHIDYIVHMAAESHVDNSIEDPKPFFESNVIGTVNMLELARKIKPELFVYVSTDEVYGPSIDGHLHKEGEPHKPSNPYSASKSGGEAACYSYWNTYKMPIIITNTMNNFGERQHPEKFFPKVVKAVLDGKSMTIHCKKDKKGKVLEISSRCWLHARNHADGILFLIENGVPGESYNITGEWASVEDIARMIATALDRPIRIVYEDFHSFREGHDMHYGLNGDKMARMGWRQPFGLKESLSSCAIWTSNNRRWLL